MHAATFEGVVGHDCYKVLVHGRGPTTWLGTADDLWYGDPAKLTWGDKSDGSRLCALTILRACVGPFYALACVDAFLTDVVSKLPEEPWTLGEAEVIDWFEAFIGTRTGRDLATKVRKAVQP